MRLSPQARCLAELAAALYGCCASCRSHRSKKYVKFLIVGDSGLVRLTLSQHQAGHCSARRTAGDAVQGKTTLIRALFSVPGQELTLHDGTETSPAQFRWV